MRKLLEPYFESFKFSRNPKKLINFINSGFMKEIQSDVVKNV